MSSVQNQLAAVVGPAHVLVDPALRAAYETDWTGRFTGRAAAVVRPGTTSEVARVLKVCAEHGLPVVPRGGGTGLVGASVPRGDGTQVVLSTERLARVDPVDVEAGQVTVGAGVTLGRLQSHAAAAGLSYGVDLAARDSATVGGMVATNAGGVHVIGYGPTRAQVRGLEAVLADGRVLSHLGGLVKDNTGYDLDGLLTGSEGTLAIVTAARLQLRAAPTHRTTALVGLPGIAAAVELVARLRAGVDGLVAAELVLADGVALVRRVAGLPAPLATEHPAYLLVETAGRTDGLTDLAEVLAAYPDDAVAVATDTTGRDRLWAYRERHTEAVATTGVPHKLDVTLPAGALADFADRVRREAQPHQVWLWGHVGDGNLHVNVVGPAPDDDAVDDAVLMLVAELGGSISAEHGIGVAKARWLGLCRSKAEIAAMRAIKDAWDPDDRLNPGVLFG